ncbi:MAG: NIPSNAP family protein, partial [Betaproteobacteria bacterium]|nr:NIPSNAP family protein [Betaproteobacteria bacterium]
MYVEERMYLLHPGKAPEYFKHYEEVGMKVQLKHLPNLVGYYVTEVGTQNLVTHMWAYDDLNQR